MDKANGSGGPFNGDYPAITCGTPRSLYRYVEGGLVKVDLATGIQYFLPDEDTARTPSEENRAVDEN